MAIPPRNKGGRPYKGPRRVLTVRPPDEMADEVIRQADAAGMTINDFVIAKLAKTLELTEEQRRRWVAQQPLDPGQHVLALGA